MAQKSSLRLTSPRQALGWKRVLEIFVKGWTLKPNRSTRGTKTLPSIPGCGSAFTINEHERWGHSSHRELHACFITASVCDSRPSFPRHGTSVIRARLTIEVILGKTGFRRSVPPNLQTSK